MPASARVRHGGGDRSARRHLALERTRRRVGIRGWTRRTSWTCRARRTATSVPTGATAQEHEPPPPPCPTRPPPSSPHRRQPPKRRSRQPDRPCHIRGRGEVRDLQHPVALEHRKLAVDADRGLVPRTLEGVRTFRLTVHDEIG